MKIETEHFRKSLEKLYAENSFYKFDEFITRKFSNAEGTLTEDIRKEAYHNFFDCIGRVYIADRMTMRKWFGINGYSKPSRLHIFKMGFLLGLERQEVEQYLLEGLSEDGFHVNDYNEIIYLYGFEKHLSYEACQKMIHSFEKKIDVNIELDKSSNTQMVKARYEESKRLDVEGFMHFLYEHASVFKGYNNTALLYMVEYRKKVLFLIREEAKKRLEELLSETDYREWEKRTFYSKKISTYEKIKRYLRSRYGKKIGEMFANNIRELAKIAYSSLENNSLIYSELFNQAKGMYSKSKYSEVKSMSMKHMSDLFRVDEQKENAIKVVAALRTLEGLEKTETCPKNVLDFTYEIGYKEQGENCEEIVSWLMEYDKEHKRRQLEVQRGDLLPFVLYVAQQRYLEQIEWNLENYKQMEARTQFREQADAVLVACGMLPLDEKRELDAVLLCCFQETEMYSYSDLIEVLYE